MSELLSLSLKSCLLLVSDGGGSEETGSDKVLAFAVSPSGKLLALTDDNKRLVLLQRQESWTRLSTRYQVPPPAAAAQTQPHSSDCPACVCVRVQVRGEEVHRPDLQQC